MDGRTDVQDDDLIFVSKSSMPKLRLKKAAAGDGRPDVGARARKPSKPPPKEVLICGWRPKWNKAPSHLRKRVEELSSSLSPGSTIVFMNSLPKVCAWLCMRASVRARVRAC